MNKKLLSFFLTVIMVLVGASIAVGCSTTPQDPEPITYTVTFTAGDDVKTYTVQEGETLAEEPAMVERNGYSSKWVDASGAQFNISTPITANASYTLEYTARTDTTYKVEHYTAKLVRGYALEQTDTLEGTTDTTVTASPIEITGFTYDPNESNTVLSGTVSGDGSLVLKLFYSRNSYTVKFVANGTELASESVKFGATVSEYEGEVTKAGDAEYSYEFKYWSLTENGEAYSFSNEITDNVTLYAVFEAKLNQYAVDVETDTGFYSITKKDGTEWTNAELTSFNYNQIFNFKINLSEEADGDIIVKADDQVITPVDGVYSVTVLGDVTVTVSGYTMREYTARGQITLDVKQSAIDWAKTVTSPEQVVVVVNGSEYYENVVDATGVYEVDGLVKGDYEITFAYKSEDGYKTISNDVVTVSVGADLADANGVVEAEGAIVGTIMYSLYSNSNKTYGIHNGVINATELIGTGGDNLFVSMTEFKPGDADFVTTVTYEQVVTTEKTSLESSPTLGMRFYNGADFITLGLYGEGNVRLVIDGKNNDLGRTLNQVGGIFGQSGWGDTFRFAQFTYVKRGNIVAFYATLKGGNFLSNGTIKQTSARTLTNMLMYYIDLETNTLYMSDNKHGVSSNGSETWAHKTFTNDAFSKIFSNVTGATAQMMTSKTCWIDLYGMNYSMDESTIEKSSCIVTGTIKNANSKAQADNYVHFTSADGTVMFAPVTNGQFTAYLPVGEYNVTGMSGYQSTTKLVVSNDTDNAGEFNLTKLTYANRVQNDYGNKKHTINDDGSLTGVATNPVETAVNTSFIPNQQILTFGYTLKGNLSATNYPYYGMFVMNPTSRYTGYTVESTNYTSKYRMARIIFTSGLGGMLGTLNEANTANGKVGGSRFNFGPTTEESRWFAAGWITGQKDLNLATPTYKGNYSEDMYADLSLKFVIDGYKISLYVKGSNTYWGDNDDADTIMNNLITWHSDEWVECFKDFDLKARVEVAMPQHISQLYLLDQVCYFGVSSREDAENGADGKPVNLSSYHDIWYELENRA